MLEDNRKKIVILAGDDVLTAMVLTPVVDVMISSGFFPIILIPKVKYNPRAQEPESRLEKFFSTEILHMVMDAYFTSSDKTLTNEFLQSSRVLSLELLKQKHNDAIHIQNIDDVNSQETRDLFTSIGSASMVMNFRGLQKYGLEIIAHIEKNRKEFTPSRYYYFLYHTYLIH